MIARKYAQPLFGLLLSGMMSLLVSGVATFRMTGLAATFTESWLGAWLAAWGIAFPSVLLLAPLTRRLVDRITSAE